ncbi:vitamin B12-dependent ribonucleotide reductase [Chloroflexota bacterium]
MNNTNPSEEQRQTELDRTEILRAVVADAESMGLRDKDKIEQLTSRVIERLERPQTLPGMEDLVPKSHRQQRRIPTRSEIQAIVKEILAAEEPIRVDEAKTDTEAETVTKPERQSAGSEKKEEKTMAEPIIQAGPKTQPATDIALSENAIRVLERRYLKKDKQGQAVETPEEMFRRVAQAIATAELAYDSSADVKAKEDEFYQLMVNLEFLPNSPTLMNAGRELGQLSACFVLPIEDSMESIFDAVKNTALIHKSGGGTGFSFSILRPEMDRVGSTGGVASGPVSFMRAFDTATDVIKQGGMRRGANMAILSVDHPDIEKFIHAKDNPTAFTNFNLSVAVTNEFMEAVKAGTDYDLVNPHTEGTQGKANAAEIFNEIVASAWRTGDPGVVFIDQINLYNPTPQLGKIESTNPCGEQPLLPYESCNLGSINLSRMLRPTDGSTEVDYVKLAETVKTAVRFLDNVIDVNKFPLPEIEQRTKETRKIGLGIMGFADMLIQLGISYDSDEALAVALRVMQFINEEAGKASAELAKERGVFPAFEGSIYDVPNGPRPRNASCTTIAPTGTLSIIAGCSSGIEPLFALSYIHNILDGARMVETNPYFEETARNEGFYSEELIEKLATGTQLHSLEEIPDKVKRVFVTAHEINPEWHVRMQAAFQKSTHNAVSKTVNFPQEATEEDIAKVYSMAYDLELKGITIYRDKSRDEQPLSTSPVEKKEAQISISPRERSKVTTGITERVTTGCGYMYVTVNSDEQGLFEVFSTLGKAGGCAIAQLETSCRLISLALRSGVDVSKVVKQLRGIRCPSIAWEQGKAVLSCGDAIASVLEKYTKSDTGNDGKSSSGIINNPPTYAPARNVAGQCPECASLLAYQEGCYVCHGCGYTKC